MEIRTEKPQLIVVRHGETAWSMLGKHTSHTDLPLTALGEQSARELKTKLQTHAVTRVFSSPLLRARATAELSGFAEHAVVTSDLTEWNYGDDEGRTTLEIRADRPGWSIWREGPRNGETVVQVRARVDRFIAIIQKGKGDALAFAHGHILDVLAARWLGLEASLGRLFYMDTTTISVFGWHYDEPVLKQWNTP